MDRKQSTGTFFAFGASLALASSFVFSKSVLNNLSIFHFGFLWFGLGVIWNAAWFLGRRDYRQLKVEFGRKTAVALLVAGLEGAATGLFYKAIQAMENPAVVSFIGNIGPVFVTIMGLGLLRERFRTGQMAGILVTILGVFVMNYREGGFAGFTDPGAIYVILASFLFSLATIAGRKFREHMNPSYMSLLRSLMLAVTMAFLFYLKGGSAPLDIGAQVWRDLALGSFLETMIVIVFAYQALKMIEATRTSLIISSKAVWTLILAWIFLEVFPSALQVIGGMLTLVGVWFITQGPSKVPQE